MESPEIVLERDAKFPAWKKELVNQHGWKVFDLTEIERVHASTMLGKLPEKKYVNIEEVIESLRMNF